jgi:hypothetical protein
MRPGCNGVNRLKHASASHAVAYYAAAAAAAAAPVLLLFTFEFSVLSMLILRGLVVMLAG